MPPTGCPVWRTESAVCKRRWYRSARGGSFDIGRLTLEDKARIRLADKKPLVLRPRLVNTDDPDDDKLERLFERSLREASAPVGRGRQPSLVYVPVAEEFPGALRVSGSYAEVDGKITGRLTLRRDGKVIASTPFEGKAKDLPAVARELTRRIAVTPQPAGKSDDP